MVIEWFSYSGVIIMANHNGLQECSKQIWREELRAHPLLITNCVWDKHFVCAAQCGSIIQSFALIISMWPYQTIWNWNKGKRKLSHMILFLLSCILLSSNILRCFFSSCWLFFWWGSIYQTGPTHSELHNPQETHWWKLTSRFIQLVSVFTAAAVPFLFFSLYSIKSVQFVTFWWLAVFQLGNQQKHPAFTKHTWGAWVVLRKMCIFYIQSDLEKQEI